MHCQQFILPWPPSGNVYWRYVNGRVLVSSKARLYKQTLGWFCRNASLILPPLELALHLDFFPPDKRARDGHNFAKILLDALEGLLYLNDRQVTYLAMDYHRDEIVALGSVHCRAEVRQTGSGHGKQEGTARQQKGARGRQEGIHRPIHT